MEEKKNSRKKLTKIFQGDPKLSLIWYFIIKH